MIEKEEPRTRSSASLVILRLVAKYDLLEAEGQVGLRRIPTGWTGFPEAEQDPVEAEQDPVEAEQDPVEAEQDPMEAEGLARLSRSLWRPGQTLKWS
jgi:hypothetical protein